MSVAPEVIIHDIKDTDYLPTDVVELFSQLSCPLPKHIEMDEVRNRLSPGTLEMYEEALLSDISFGDNVDGRPVTDVIDTELSCEGSRTRLQPRSTMEDKLGITDCNAWHFNRGRCFCLVKSVLQFLVNLSNIFLGKS